MKIMDDKEFEKLMKSIDTEVMPPDGLKEKILGNTMLEHSEEPVLNSIERFIYEKPLRAACILSVTISVALWAVLGNDMVRVFSSIITGVNAI